MEEQFPALRSIGIMVFLPVHLFLPIRIERPIRLRDGPNRILRHRRRRFTEHPQQVALSAPNIQNTRHAFLSQNVERPFDSLHLQRGREPDPDAIDAVLDHGYFSGRRELGRGRLGVG